MFVWNWERRSQSTNLSFIANLHQLWHFIFQRCLCCQKDQSSPAIFECEQLEREIQTPGTCRSSAGRWPYRPFDWPRLSKSVASTWFQIRGKGWTISGADPASLVTGFIGGPGAKPPEKFFGPRPFFFRDTPFSLRKRPFLYEHILTQHIQIEWHRRVISIAVHGPSSQAQGLLDRPAHLSILPLNLSIKKLPDFQWFSTSRSKIRLYFRYFLAVHFIPLSLTEKHRSYHVSRITTKWLRVLHNLHRFPTFSDRVATFYDRFRTPLRQGEQCGDRFQTRQREVSDFLWMDVIVQSNPVQIMTQTDQYPPLLKRELI